MRFWSPARRSDTPNKMPRVQPPKRTGSSASSGGGSVSGFLLLCMLCGGLFYAWKQGMLPADIDCSQLPGMSGRQLPAFLTPLHIPQPSELGLGNGSASSTSVVKAPSSPNIPTPNIPTYIPPTPLSRSEPIPAPAAEPKLAVHTRNNMAQHKASTPQSKKTDKKSQSDKRRPTKITPIERDYEARLSLDSLGTYRSILPESRIIRQTLVIESFANRLQAKQDAPYPRISTRFKTKYSSIDTLLADLRSKLTGMGFVETETPITDYQSGGTTVLVGRKKDATEIYIALKSESYDDLTAWKVEVY